MSERKAHQTVVGFSAETRDVVSYAKEKLVSKKLDYIVANEVGKLGSGFAADMNEVVLIAADGSSVKQVLALNRSLQRTDTLLRP